MGAKYPDVRISYQGVACQYGQFSCPYGIASGNGFVVMAQVGWRKLILGDPWGKRTERTAGVDASAGSLSGTLAIAGALSMRRGDRSIVLPHLYVADSGIEDVKRSAETTDLGLVRVPLVDVRYLWTRGDLHGEYNIPKNATGLPVPRRSGTAPREDAALPEFKPHSVKPDGKPYTLLDMVKLCLARLPGQLGIVPNEETKAADKIIPENLRYRGSPASKALAELLQVWNFRLVYDPFFHRIELWRFNEGRPESEQRGVVTANLRFPTGAGAIPIAPNSILRRARATQFFYRPKSVRVVGPPVIREVQVPLELAGEINGEVVPLDAALAFHGFTREEAARWVLLPAAAQRRWRGGAVRPATVMALNKWAFRMAKLPEDIAGFRPILTERVRTMIDGVPRPPLVLADRHDEVSFEQWLKIHELMLEDIQNRAATLVERIAADLKAASEAKLALEIQRLKLQGADGLAGFLEEVTKIVTFSDVSAGMSPRNRAALEAHLAELERLLTNNLAVAQANAAIERREIAATEEREIRLFNIPCELLDDSLYRVDPQGVVRFTKLIGHIQFSRVDTLDPTRRPSEKIYVRSTRKLVHDVEPQIRMTFAYRSTPEAREAMSRLLDKTGSLGVDEAVGSHDQLGDTTAFDKVTDYVDHFTFLGVLDDKGKVKRLNALNIEPEDSALLYPKIVGEEALQQYVDIEGNTNRSELETLAASIVKRELEGDLQAVGEKGESADFYPITPTGAVAVVEWEVTPPPATKARTRWTVGVERAIESRQATQTRLQGLRSGAGSRLNPDVGGR